MPQAREYFVVFNPGSGSQDKDEARSAMEQAFREAGARFRMVPIEGHDVRAACLAAARLARDAAGVLVVAGGDGTINSAAQAAHTADCVLGVVAQGTFNMFARDHGLPLDDAGESVRVLLRAQPRDVQVGSVNQQLFLVNASLGLYPKILSDREEMKQKLGRKRWVAFIAALRTLLNWRARLVLEAELDGRPARMKTPSLFVGNNRMQLERVGMPASVLEGMDGGRLGAIVSCELDAWAKLRLLVDGLLGRLGQAPEIQAFTLRSMTVSTPHARRMRVAVDGEIRWMELPLRIAVAARPLRVLLPGGQARSA